MRICIPIRENNLEKVKKQVRRAEKAARGLKEVLMEIWLDGIEGNRQQETGYSEGIREIGNREIPIIAVCRGSIEHGSFKGSEKERVKRLENAVAAGAKFVDVGIHTNPSLIKNLKKICLKKRARPSRNSPSATFSREVALGEAKHLMRPALPAGLGATLLIISKHFYASTPDLKILLKIHQRAKRLGADIVKIAAFVKNWSDNVILFELTKHLASRGERIIVIGMGAKGKISRIGCPLLGSYLTYAALDKKSRTAKGQFAMAALKSLITRACVHMP